MNDKYGGTAQVSFEPTGFFRLEQNDRWWFVTPEGNAFLSFGLNHVVPGFLLRPYNVEHWEAKFGSRDVEDAGFGRAFEKKVRSDFEAFGLNTLGCHSAVGRYSESWCAYVQSLPFVRINHSKAPPDEAFVDVFAPEFAAHCDTVVASHVEPRKEDPHLLGYSFCDCPIFTEIDAAERGVCIYGDQRAGTQTWPRKLRNLGAGSPGKAAYVETIRYLYHNDIGTFNRNYGTRFASFDALLAAERWRPHAVLGNRKETRDNLVFLQRVVDRYYETAVEAIRRADSNHLIFGDKLNMNTGVPIEIVRVVARYTDLLFYQHYGYFEQQQPYLDEWYGDAGKPLFNGDSSFSVPDENMSRPLGPHLTTQEARAAAFKEYATEAFSCPDYVGWNWCGWVDSWEVAQPRRQHSGIQTAFGEPYAPLQKAMREFGDALYDVAQGR